MIYPIRKRKLRDIGPWTFGKSGVQVERTFVLAAIILPASGMGSVPVRVSAQQEAMQGEQARRLIAREDVSVKSAPRQLENSPRMASTRPQRRGAQDTENTAPWSAAEEQAPQAFGASALHAWRKSFV